MDLIFDIETALDEAFIEGMCLLPRTFKADGRVADAAASSAKKEAGFPKKLRSEGQLSPLLGRVATFGYWRSDSDGMDVYDDVQDITEPADLAAEVDFLTLQKAAGIIEEAQRIVTFNGTSFDLHFMAVRMAVNGIPVPAKLIEGLRKYTYFPHIDLRTFLTNWDQYAIGRLPDWCLRFNITPPEDHSPEQIQEAAKKRDRTYLSRIVRDDVRGTAELFRRLEATVGFQRK